MARRIPLLLTISALFLAISALPASPLIARKLSGEQTAIGGEAGGSLISPDGRYAVYRGDLINEGIYEIFSIRISGGSPIRISTGQHFGKYGTYFLHISPDSEWLYFLAGGKIFRTRIDGSTTPILAHGDLGFYEPEIDHWITRDAHLPQLGRGGRYLYFFASSYTGHGGVPHFVYRTDLFRIDLSDHTLAENITEGTALSKHHIYRFEVSDDAQSLLVHAFCNESDYRDLSRIYHLDLNSASATLLPTPDYVPKVKMSPDGSRALIEWREEIVHASLRQFPPLPEPEIISDEEPVEFDYSPDSRWIIFRTASGLFKRPIDGGDALLIAPSASARFFDADGRLVFSASIMVGETTVTHLFSVRLDDEILPTRLTHYPLVSHTEIQQSPDRRSALLFEALPVPGGTPDRRLVIVLTDGSSPPKQLNDPGYELPEYPIYRSAKFTGQSGRVVYTKGTLHVTAAIYSGAADSPPKFIAQTESGSSPQPLPTTANTERIFFWHAGDLFATELGGGEPAIKLSFSKAIGADVSAVKLSPDGSQALYLLDAETVGRTELFSVSIDGGKRTKLSHQLEPKPSDESVVNFWARPEGQVTYSSSSGAIYSADLGTAAPPALLQEDFYPLGPNANRRFLLGFSSRQLTAIDLDHATSAVADGPEGEVRESSYYSQWEPQPFPGYLLEISGSRAIYISGRASKRHWLMSWPFDDSTPPIDLAAGETVRQFTLAPAIDRVVYRTSTGAIFSVPPAGGNRLQLLAPDNLQAQPDFFSVTADGEWLIYGSGNSMWRVSTSPGGTAVNLAEHLAADQSIVSIVIASNGSKLAYAAATPPGGLRVYTLRIDGEPAPQQVFSAETFSDETKLVAAGNRFLLFAWRADYDLKLFLLPDEPGSPPAILSSNDNVRTGSLGDNFILSGDQSRIVFVERHTDDDGNLSYELVAAPVDGSERATVIAPGLPPQFATNSDGTSIAYISNREHQSIDELFLTKIDPEVGSYDGWLARNFSPEDLAEPGREPDLWHRNSDPDADGIENWLERISALNPLEAERVAPYQLILGADANAHLRFRSAKNLSELPIIECSGDLSHWQPAERTVRVINDVGDAWLLETEIDRVGSGSVYLRLREGN